MSIRSKSHSTPATADANIESDFDPQSLIGYEFIHNVDGHGYRAKVTDCFEDQKKFMVALGDGSKDEIVSYNEMIDVVSNVEEGHRDPRLGFGTYVTHHLTLETSGA